MTGDEARPVFADFADGESATLHRVRVEVVAAAVELHMPDGGAPVLWPFGEVRRLPDQAASDGLVLGLAGDHPARLMIADKDLAARLSLSRVAHVEGDASVLARYMTIGSIFFLYCPFSGERLAKVVADLADVARTRTIRVCTVDTPVPPCLWLDPEPEPAAALNVAVYRSTLCEHPYARAQL